MLLEESFKLERARRALAFTNWPEFNVFIFAVLLNYPWELMQVPFYEGMASSAHWGAVKVCTWATLADGIIMLIAYWGAAIVARDRWWFLKPRPMPLIVLLTIGVAITVLLERLATVSANPDWGWRYAEIMPIVPGLEIGLTPFLQWIVLPLLMVWFVKRQLRGGVASRH